jgi:AcrR family transcriptional regulator
MTGDLAASPGARATSRASGEESRRRLIAAAAQTVRDVGYAGASARTIARAADVNAALVFYHFGGVDQLLLAALAASSEERMIRHRAAVAGVRRLEDLVEVGRGIYLYDLEQGHIALFSELVAAAVSRPHLRAGIVAQAEPWLIFLEETIDQVIGGSPLAALMPPRDLANAAMTFYLGVNLFTVIDEDRSRTESVFDLATRLAPRARLLTARLPGRTRPGRP